MNFLILTLMTSGVWVPLLGEGLGVGGFNTSLRLAATVHRFGPRSSGTFCLYMDPLMNGGGPESKFRHPHPPPPPRYGPLPVRILPCSGGHTSAHIFPKPFSRPWDGLG